MTCRLADSPIPVPMHVCFHSGFDWAYRLAAGRKKAWRRPEIHRPGSRAACWKQQASDQKRLVQCANPAAPCMSPVWDHFSLYVWEREKEREREWVCVFVYVCMWGRGAAYFTGTWCMHIKSTAPAAINSCIWMSVISHAMTYLHERSQHGSECFQPLRAFRLCVNALRAMCLPF